MRLKVDISHGKLPTPRLDVEVSIRKNQLEVAFDGDCFRGGGEATLVDDGCLMGCDGRLWDAGSGPLRALAFMGDTPGAYLGLSHHRVALRVAYLDFVAGLLSHMEGVRLLLDASARMVMEMWDEAFVEEPDLSRFQGELMPHQQEALQRLLEERGVSSAVLTGSVPQRRRPEVIGRLLSGAVHVLLVTSAGGEGINLQGGADAVLLLTPWLNHTVLDQAADRVHRYGQTHEVSVYRLVTRDTVEERMVRMQDRKWASVSLSVLQRGRSSLKLSREELLEVLGEH